MPQVAEQRLPDRLRGDFGQFLDGPRAGKVALSVSVLLTKLDPDVAFHSGRNSSMSVFSIATALAVEILLVFAICRMFAMMD